MRANAYLKPLAATLIFAALGFKIFQRDANEASTQINEYTAAKGSEDWDQQAAPQGGEWAEGGADAGWDQGAQDWAA